MNLKDLKQQKSSNSVVSKSIEFEAIDGEMAQADVFVKILSYESVFEINKAFDYDVTDENNPKLKNINLSLLQITRILKTICADDKGTPLFSSAKEIEDLIPSLGWALFKVADEVNNFQGKSKTKNLDKTNSSENSSSQE